jgi:hypothetical protein
VFWKATDAICLSHVGSRDSRIQKHRKRRTQEFQQLVRASIPQGDELLPEDVLGLTDEDFADIASRWATGHE